ncbi:hypothetical protein QTI24_21540 [Variovorax sp. J22P240]|uniref:hypothetical protein n=1 Tax=Variovorax sp. J22P240 TaxID=3053514 RepID=UPI0025782BF2|nr:hypothetical protein [Variovorax sp. J22P240]MDM0001205.1 hypothetical protein [Variovorax sp. J22P240]
MDQSETRDFASRADARNFLASRLVELGVMPAVALHVAAECVDDFGVKSDGGFRARLGRWVIRSDDLDLIATLSPALVAAATAVADSKSMPAVVTAVATSISSAILLARRLMRRAVKLTPSQLRLVAALQLAGGSASLAQIVLAVAGAPDLADPEEVSRTLVGLSDLRLSSGLTRGLVERTADGNWHLLDL